MLTAPSIIFSILSDAANYFFDAIPSSDRVEAADPFHLLGLPQLALRKCMQLMGTREFIHLTFCSSFAKNLSRLVKRKLFRLRIVASPNSQTSVYLVLDKFTKKQLTYSFQDGYLDPTGKKRTNMTLELLTTHFQFIFNNPPTNVLYNCSKLNEVFFEWCLKTFPKIRYLYFIMIPMDNETSVFDLEVLQSTEHIFLQTSYKSNINRRSLDKFILGLNGFLKRWIEGNYPILKSLRISSYDKLDGVAFEL